MTPRRPRLYAAVISMAGLIVAAVAIWAFQGGSDPAPPTTVALPIPTAHPALPSTPTPTPTPAATASGPEPAEHDRASGCTPRFVPHGTDSPTTWRPEPLPWSAPCVLPPGSVAWRPGMSLAASDPDLDPPIRIVARPEILPDGIPADPVTGPPPDVLERVRGVAAAWARWLEADRAAAHTANPDLLAGLAAFIGAERHETYYTQLARERAAAGAHTCGPLALDAALLAVDLRDEVAHTLSWSRGGGAACHVGEPPDTTLIGNTDCVGALELRHHAWAWIDGEWLMAGLFALDGRHAAEMRAWAGDQDPTFDALFWRSLHYTDRVEAEYAESGWPCS